MTIENKIVSRKCIFSKKIIPKSKMIRFVKSKDSIIRIDFDLNIHGRGAYIINDKKIIKEALSKKALNRAFKQNIEKKKYQKLWEEMEQFYDKEKK